MALRITPGPLPANGTRIRIAPVLQAFVGGTDITSFGPADFEGSDLTFMTSTTDPPATDSRTRATLWFARGEGKLYKWEIHPQTDSGVTEGSWLAMTVRRDVLVKQVDAAVPGQVLVPAPIADEYKTELSLDGRYTLKTATTSTSDSAIVIDPALLATESGTGIRVAVEWGFADAYVSGGGILGYADPSTAARTDVLHLGDQADWTNQRAVAALASESDASSAEVRLKSMFLRPALTNWVR